MTGTIEMPCHYYVFNTRLLLPMLRHIISIHQQGKTDFSTFCEQVAAAGVKQWVIDTERMLCIYEDIDGKEMVAESIPDVSYNKLK